MAVFFFSRHTYNYESVIVVVVVAACSSWCTVGFTTTSVPSLCTTLDTIGPSGNATPLGLLLLLLLLLFWSSQFSFNGFGLTRRIPATTGWSTTLCSYKLVVGGGASSSSSLSSPSKPPSSRDTTVVFGISTPLAAGSDPTAFPMSSSTSRSVRTRTSPNTRIKIAARGPIRKIDSTLWLRTMSPCSMTSALYSPDGFPERKSEILPPSAACGVALPYHAKAQKSASFHVKLEKRRTTPSTPTVRPARPTANVSSDLGSSDGSNSFEKVVEEPTMANRNGWISTSQKALMSWLDVCLISIMSSSSASRVNRWLHMTANVKTPMMPPPGYL
eukprot:PhM_4_TR11290/c3_g1_i2/m.93265